MIGYYAHQHGSGHLNFARLFAKVFGDEICTFSSLKKPEALKGQFVQLADENPDGTASEENQIAEPDYLHYSPVGQRSIQLRSAQILKEVVERNIKLMIVDHSFDVLGDLFPRLISILIIITVNIIKTTIRKKLQNWRVF